MLLNTTDNTIFSANFNTITQYPRSEIASEKEDGAKIVYRRWDIFYSPVLLEKCIFRYGTRNCKMPPDMYVSNTVSLAMARLNMFLAPKVHHPQDNINIDKEITIGPIVILLLIILLQY